MYVPLPPLPTRATPPPLALESARGLQTPEISPLFMFCSPIFPEFFQIFLNFSEFFWIFPNFSEFFRIFLNFPEFLAYSIPPLKTYTHPHTQSRHPPFFSETIHTLVHTLKSYTPPQIFQGMYLHPYLKNFAKSRMDPDPSFCYEYICSLHY